MKILPSVSIATVGISIAIAVAQSANAITFSIGGISVPGQGEFSPVPGVTTINFESGVPTGGTAIYSTPGSDPAVVFGNLDETYVAPNSTRYLNVAPFGDWRGTTPVAISFVQPIDYFGLYWGSTDPYNSISFYQDANLIQSFSGAIFPGSNNIYANFFANLGETFNRVVLHSTSAAFESDNHAYKLAATSPEPPTSVPEPASILSLFAFGTFGVSSVLKRRKQKTLDCD